MSSEETKRKKRQAQFSDSPRAAPTIALDAPTIAVDGLYPATYKKRSNMRRKRSPTTTVI
jgi:hypothetical protein